MQTLRSLLFIFVLMALYSCGVTYDIVSDIEKGINFYQYKTFVIIHDDHGFEKGANPINKRRIDRAVENEFREIGYTYSDSPDLHITWFVKVDTKLEPGIYNAYYQRWRSPRAVEVYEYQVGSLVIDIVDTGTGQIIWHAIASSKVYDDMPDIENRIKEVVKEIFKTYQKDTGIKKINSYVFK